MEKDWQYKGKFMKLGVLASITILVAIAIPAAAKAQRIDCYRNGNVIDCPGYGSFDYRRNSNPDRWNNGNRNSADIDNAIEDIYRQVLGRDADFNGLNTYRAAVQKGASLSQVRRDLINSSEASQAIDRIYRQILGRPADRNGIDTYKRALENGASLDQVRRDIANSEEARSRGRR